MVLQIEMQNDSMRILDLVQCTQAVWVRISCMEWMKRTRVLDRISGSAQRCDVIMTASLAERASEWCIVGQG